MYNTTANINTKTTPIIVNHLEPCLFINSVNKWPNLYDRKEIIKNLKPLEMILTIININKLN